MQEDYVHSDAFLLFVDKALRESACLAVDTFLKDNAPIDTAQLQSIPSVIQAGGLDKLEELVVKQKEKNTKERNKKFWEFVYQLIFADPGPECSLRSIISSLQEVRKMLKKESGGLERKESKRIRKENKALVDQVINYVLPVYFEHFNCHYFFMTREQS